MSFVRDRLPEPAVYFEAEGLALKGRGNWRSTLCVFHEDRDPSLRINVQTGAWCCMSCGTKGGDLIAFHMQRRGVDFVTAARELGCWDDDGKPAPRLVAGLPPRAALEVLAFESLLVATAAGTLAKGIALTDADRARLVKAAGRIQRVSQQEGAH